MLFALSAALGFFTAKPLQCVSKTFDFDIQVLDELRFLSTSEEVLLNLRILILGSRVVIVRATVQIPKCDKLGPIMQIPLVRCH